MANSTLQQIYNTIRRICRIPSPSQMSDADLNIYVNTFVQFDFPENIRLAYLRTTLTFYTQPNIDIYGNSTDPNSGLYDFDNIYTAVHPPAFIAGVPSLWTQNRSEFFGIWPMLSYVSQTGLFGDGTTTSFSGTVGFNAGLYPGTVGTPIMQNQVNFNALDVGGDSMILVDYPVSNTTGALGLVNAPQVIPSPYGSINYLTGVYSVNFPLPPAAGQPIQVESVPYGPGKPISILFYQNKFTLRPIPITTYGVTVEADIRPTELLSSTQNPQICQWWQYIALGACMKIFRDKMDMDSMNMLYPEFDKQERLVLRATLEIKTNQRAPTIYQNGRNYNNGAGFGNIQWPY